MVLLLVLERLDKVIEAVIHHSILVQESVVHPAVELEQ
jgi:hypothetical protein